VRDSSGQIITYGKGRSYGDASLNTAGRTILLDRLNAIVEFDAKSGVIVCEAGVTLEQILNVAIPAGWFLPVTPGTRFPTIGGCLAADVHGKNHHVAGSISQHVRWFEIVLADGSRVRCSLNENTELFHATAGGMGLTGIICLVALQLSTVETSWIVSEKIATDSLRETMQELTANDTTWPYTVAWIDCMASGDAIGRGDVILGRHARADELSQAQLRNKLQTPPMTKLGLPFTPPLSLVNRLTTKIFNTVFGLSGRMTKRRASVLSAWAYFYPLDVAHSWNRLYGPPGFVQYQIVVPLEVGYEAIRHILDRCLVAGHPSSLAVLKRFGEAQGYLSFPKPGWTLALDIAVRPGLFDLLGEFDRFVIEQGGRVYLAKDAVLGAENFRKMYFEYGKWLEVKKAVDPQCRFSSDLSRRLDIEGDVRGNSKLELKKMQSVKKNSWMIVGAAGGIGSAVAMALARKGCDLALVDVGERIGEVERLALRIREETGRKATCHSFGEGSVTSIESLLDRVEEAGEAPFGYLWAAGVMWQQSDLQLDADKAARHHFINYTLPMLFLETVANRIERQGSGHIAAIGSPAGDRARRSNYLYGADKAALHAYLDGLAHRFAGLPVIITTIKPGPTRTPMTEGMEKLPLLAEPGAQGKRIARGLLGGAKEIYTPAVWRPIMTVIKLLPKFVFDRLDI